MAMIVLHDAHDGLSYDKDEIKKKCLAGMRTPPRKNWQNLRGKVDYNPLKFRRQLQERSSSVFR